MPAVGEGSAVGAGAACGVGSVVGTGWPASTRTLFSALGTKWHTVVAVSRSSRSSTAGSRCAPSDAIDWHMPWVYGSRSSHTETSKDMGVFCITVCGCASGRVVVGLAGAEAVPGAVGLVGPEAVPGGTAESTPRRSAIHDSRAAIAR